MVGRMPLSATSDDHDYFASPYPPPPNEDDDEATRPMCGHAVFSKVLLKKSSPSPNRVPPSSSNASPNRNCLVPTHKGPFSRRRYEEVNRHLLASPEDTESSSTNSSSDDHNNNNNRHQSRNQPGSGARRDATTTRSNRASNTSDSFIVQFVHGLEGTTEVGAAAAASGTLGSPSATSSATSSSSLSPSSSSGASPQRQRQLHIQPMGFGRTGLWSSPLPAVTEETSSVETEETPRDAGTEGGPPPFSSSGVKAAKTGTTTTSTSGKHNHKYTSPEKNEMLAAMRNLVLKQQSALKELSKENTHYRKKMEDYQNAIIKMKRVQTEQDGKLAQLQLEKEAFEAEAMWLRGQIELMSRGMDLDDDDDEVQRKLRNLMLGGSDALTPSSNAERAATDAFNSFKRRTLSPGTVMDRAVKSLHGSKSAPWGWDERLVVDARDDDNNNNDDENRSTTSESVPDDERMMSMGLAKSRSHDSKSDPAKQQQRKAEARDDEPGASTTKSKSDTPPRPPPTSAKPSSVTQPRTEASSVNPPTTPRSEASTPTSWSSPGKREEVDIFRQRLESIQKKRSERQADRGKQSSRPTVRFGMISI